MTTKAKFVDYMNRTHPLYRVTITSGRGSHAHSLTQTVTVS